MKVFLPAFIAFLIIILGFIWVTRTQVEDYGQKSEAPISLTNNNAIKSQKKRGENFAFQNNEVQQKYNQSGQYINLSWEILSKVRYYDQYDQEKGHYHGAMMFDPMVKVVDNRDVIIQGYLIEIPDADQAPFYLLSAYPTGESFLSGRYGSETAMDLYFEGGEHTALEEKKITVTGRFSISDQDFAGLYYSLKGVKILEGY